MPEEMILEIVDAYGQAAAKLKSIGFEMLTSDLPPAEQGRVELT
jgi:hypothetical protein